MTVLENNNISEWSWGFCDSSIFLLYRKVRPIKQNAPRGCAQMRKEYCCKRHATRIWHTKWSKSLMNEGFRELMWTCPLCSKILRPAKLQICTSRLCYIAQCIVLFLFIITRFLEENKNKELVRICVM